MSILLLTSFFFSILAYSVVMAVILVKNSHKIKLQSRLDKLARDEIQWQEPAPAKRRLLKPLSGLRTPFHAGTLTKISSELSLAGINLKAEEFLMIWLICAIMIPLMLFSVTKNGAVAVIFACLGAVIPPFVVSRHKKKRATLFETQLMDALIIISNCLRAGFTFQQAMSSIAEDMSEPISKEFSMVLREIRLGISMETALKDMVARLKNDDLELVISAVLIQKQVGGNLSEVLDNIAGTIQERLKLKGEIKVLTASGKTSGLIIGLMPLFLMAFLMISNPDYISLLFQSSIGRVLLIIAAVMEIIGFSFIRKIVNIKF